MLTLTQLEPRDNPATGVVVLWPESHPWTDSLWVRGVTHYAINTVAGHVTNPAVPVVWLKVDPSPPLPGSLADGVNLGPVGAPYYGIVRFDWVELFSGKWDVVSVVAHEVAHAVVGVAWHNPAPADLLYPYARTVANPWGGALSRNDRQAFAVMGFQTDQ